MCLDTEQEGVSMENLALCEQEGSWELHSGFSDTHIENWEIESPISNDDRIGFGNDSAAENSPPDKPPGKVLSVKYTTCTIDGIQRGAQKLESISENTVVIDSEQNHSTNFVPAIRSGEWADIGERDNMEDTHVCISDLAKKYGSTVLEGEAVSFFGVFDGHGGRGAAQFVRDNLPRVIAEDVDFPLKLEKVVTRSYAETDARTYSLQSTLSSGTTAITAMIFGRSLLVANAGDCRAVLSRHGVAIVMSKDHKPDCKEERARIESLGGSIDREGYLNGQLSVSRALGNWHIEGMKEIGGGPLSAEPELKLITLTREDEFLIIGSDGVWEEFSNQNAVDYARNRLQEHNDVRLCCKEIIQTAKERGARDNLTIVMVCFHSDPPTNVVQHRPGVRRTISAGGLLNIRCILEGEH